MKHSYREVAYVEVSMRELKRSLQAVGWLPKQYTVTTTRVNKRGKVVDAQKHRYALVGIREGDTTVTVVYEILRKFAAKPPGPIVTFSVTPDGLQMVYPQGVLALKHVGEWPDTPIIQLDNLLKEPPIPRGLKVRQPKAPRELKVRPPKAPRKMKVRPPKAPRKMKVRQPKVPRKLTQQVPQKVKDTSQLAGLRLKLGLTQVEAAAQIGVSTHALHNLESGKNSSHQSKKKAASFYGVPMEELWPAPSYRSQLAELRLKLELTQVQAATKMGISAHMLQNMESGKYGCSDLMKKRVADFYGVPVHELWPLTENRSRLADLRMELGLTPRQVAAKVGVSVDTIRRMEAGEGHDYQNNARNRVASFYGVSVEELWPSWSSKIGGQGKLVELRKKLGLTQAQAAAKIGISSAMVMILEKRKRSCTVEIKQKVADFYGITIEELEAAVLPLSNVEAFK